MPRAQRCVAACASRAVTARTTLSVIASERSARIGVWTRFRRSLTASSLFKIVPVPSTWSGVCVAAWTVPAVTDAVGAGPSTTPSTVSAVRRNWTVKVSSSSSRPSAMVWTAVCSVVARAGTVSRLPVVAGT